MMSIINLIFSAFFILLSTNIFAADPPKPVRMKADSGVILQQLQEEQKNKTPKIPQTTAHEIPTPIMQNSVYLDYPICPPTPQCPSKNEPPMRPGDPRIVSCPAQCIVNREVDGTPDAIRSVTREAVCPVGYAQVGVFNMQREIIRDRTRPVIYPVPFTGPGGYQELKGLGYDCSNLRLRRGGPLHHEKCDKKDAPNPYATMINQPQSIDGYAGTYTRWRDVACFTAWCLVGPDYSCPLHAPDKKMYGYYEFYECRPPAHGLYYGTRFVPASVICSQVRSVWSKPATP